MLLTITTTHQPATDLGFLLHKHPDRVQSFALPFGQAHVYYPEVSEQRCTAALMLDIDPVDLVRNFRGAGRARLLEHYVNDRPYVASSFLSVAIGKVFRSAVAGRCKDRPALAESPIPLEARLSALPVRGGERLLHRLFEPLDYQVVAAPHPLDATLPDWGHSSYYSVTLRATKRLSELLTHLYVLIPVLDREKHYWVGDDEVEKLLHHGEAWLGGHPERKLITKRYLKFQRGLARVALERMEEAEGFQPEAHDEIAGAGEQALEQALSLNEQRMRAVVDTLQAHRVSSVIDLGCGEGKLLRYLLKEKGFSEIVGLDVSARTLEMAEARLKLDRLPERQRQRIKLIQGSLTYRDNRLAGFDAATLVEVIEHVDLDRLDALERVVFQFARPGLVAVTTPNREYNVRFEGMAPEQLRHGDHRFEWARQEFQSWAKNVAEKFGYEVSFAPIGDEDPALGAPTQMAVFNVETAADRFVEDL